LTDPAATIAGRYELGPALGHGSFGHTFRGRDTQANRDVALKVLDPREAGELKVLELFEREATVLRALRHQGVPEIFDVVRAPWNGAEATFLVMEYVEGESLAQIIEARRTLGPEEVTHLLIELLGILDYIHARVPPILHRDIKPSNIIVRRDGSPALVDFGSARNVFRPAEEAGSTVAGTYGYMPYEQFMGQATPASDIFALGATFLHLLTGRPPRDFMAASGRLEIPALLPGEERLRAILERMLEHAAGERFQSAREVRQALLASAGTPTALRSAGVRPRLRAEALALPSAPRRLDKGLKELSRQLAPGAFEMMSAGEDIEDGNLFFDWSALIFFSVLTAGILPVTYIAMARSRRRRVKHFLEHGTPAVGRVEKIATHKAPFDVPMGKVWFTFEADGWTHRFSDIVMPERADRWREGDEVQLLYDPKRNYAAIIVS
jgi:serine/threonine protein kinase